MKPFVVKPFIVNIDWTKWPRPQWQFYLLGYLLLSWGVISWAGSLVFSSDYALIFTTLTMFGWSAGLGLLTVARFVRETNTSRDELTKRVGEQEERIRKFEEKLIALTPREQMMQFAGCHFCTFCRDSSQIQPAEDNSAHDPTKGHL